MISNSDRKMMFHSIGIDTSPSLTVLQGTLSILLELIASLVYHEFKHVHDTINLLLRVER